MSGSVKRNDCDRVLCLAQATQVCTAEQQQYVRLSVAADLDVLPVVGMHELDATNSLLLALVWVGDKGAGLQCTTVDPHKSQCTLHAQYSFSPHGVVRGWHAAAGLIPKMATRKCIIHKYLW